MEQYKGKSASHDTYITSFYNWHTTKYTELSKKYRNISVRYIDNLKRTFQVQRLNTIKGKRLADIFNLNNDPCYFNDPVNTKSLYCKEYVRNRFNSRLKSLQKSFNNTVEYEMKHFIHAKLLNQSFYEKHLAVKVLEIRNQKQILINNLLLEHELLVNNMRDDYARQLYQQKHAVSLINARNNSEQNRVAELVKRLNDIKLNQNHTEHYNMCSEIIDDVIDLSINISAYGRKITSDFSRLFWQQWSTTVQDMTAMVANIASIIYVNENTGQVNRLSIEENNKSSDVELYLCVKYPWNVETDDAEATQNNSVLCHIVQKLLLAKYPLVPPNLPRVLTASAIIGITDNRLYPELEEALKDHKISTVHMHVAINYCLNSYLQDLKRKAEYVLKENACDDEELNEEYYTESLMPEDGNARLVKHTQTSGFFGLEFKFSPQADLGRLAYESLNAGAAIGSCLLTNILIQYLNTLDNTDGWTIFNYPEVYEDAVNLELGLTGKLTNTWDGEDDHLKRVSQLSSTADAASVGATSYLTSFVHVFRNSQKHCVNESLQIINTSAAAIDSFYTSLGCSSFVTYNTFNPQVIKQTVALILTDKIFESEICDAIVENTLKTVEQAENERRQSERTVSVDKKGKKTKDTKGKSSKKDKKSITSTRNVNDGTLQPAQPGELGWNYVNLPQSVNVQILLATMWENVERTYKTSLAQLFDSRRTYAEFILPYFLKIDVYFTNIIEKSSNIQEQVHAFQEYYNSLPNFYREDDEFKAELHFRIDELKQKLTDVCDKKRDEAETERQRLIRENWFANHGISLLNVYTHVVHAELNRCVETLQFIFDYYTSMLQPTLLATKFKNPSLELLKYNDSKICASVATYFLETNTDLEVIDKLLNHMTTNNNTTLNSYHTVAMENITKLVAKFTVEVKPDKKKKKKSVINPAENAELLKNIGLLKEEYQCAIKEECARVRFRLNLINSKAGSDVKELLLNGKQLFDNLSLRLMEKYQKELNNIHAICQVFADAVEWCKKMEPTVVMM